MSLIRYGGQLLRATGGGLAGDLNCCCDEPCPQCCITITSGALIDGEIKIFNSDGTASWEITITTTSRTRQVCAGEGIRIRVQTFVDDLPEPVGAIEIIGDAAWYFALASGSGASPPAEAEQQLGPNNAYLPGAWVYWTNESDVSAGFLFSPCFFNALGLLEVRIYDFPGSSAADLVEIISVTRCQPTIPCCQVPSVCEPCCRTLMPNGMLVDETWSFDGTRFKRLVTVAIGPLTYYVVFWIKAIDLDDPSLFCPSEVGSIEVGVEIGPADAASAAQFGTADVLFRLCEFGHANDPATHPASAVITSDPLLEIEWTNEDSLSYSSAFKFSCEYPGCDIIDLNVAIYTLDFGSGIAAIDMLLPLCEGSDECCPLCPCVPCLPTTLTITWTYNGVDYSFDVEATAAGTCGETATWWLIEQTFENTQPNCGPCGLFVVDYLGNCTEFELHNISVVHTCSSGWSLVLYWFGLTGGFNYGAETACQLPVSITHCGVTYTISAG
jgi:hypothetical protein